MLIYIYISDLLICILHICTRSSKKFLTCYNTLYDLRDHRNINSSFVWFTWSPKNHFCMIRMITENINTWSFDICMIAEMSLDHILYDSHDHWNSIDLLFNSHEHRKHKYLIFWHLHDCRNVIRSHFVWFSWSLKFNRSFVWFARSPKTSSFVWVVRFSSQLTKYTNTFLKIHWKEFL